MCVCGKVVKAMAAAAAVWGELDSPTQLNQSCDEKTIRLVVSPSCEGIRVSEKAAENVTTSSNKVIPQDKQSETSSTHVQYLNCGSSEYARSENNPSGDKESPTSKTVALKDASMLLSVISKSQTKVLPSTQKNSTSKYGETQCNEDETPSQIEEEYFKPLKKLRMIHELQNKSDTEANLQPLTHKNTSGVKSFSISDILGNSASTSDLNVNPEPSAEVRHLHLQSPPSRFIRPWDTDDEESHEEMSISSVSSSSDSPRPASSGPILESHPNKEGNSLSRNKGDGNPLDALFKMTSKTFDGLNSSGTDNACKQLNLFNNKQPLKKKRKSRTAFSNHQIFELEKRFLYQKYLSPADRDEMALSLGLNNAQVITWFQNRRAKLKRDMEELKKDVHTASFLGDHSAFIKTMTQMGLLKTKPNLDPSYIARK